MAKDRELQPSINKRLTAEFVGTGMLLAAIVGSGIMGDRLAGGNIALALLCNTLATGAALVALILTFGPISGAHFNPVVSFADASQGGLSPLEATGYSIAQIMGALLGAGMAHVMFGEPVYAWSQHVSAGFPQIFSEFLATFGLLAVIWGCVRRRSAAVPFAVAAYITSAYWFTASTSFANPAVTVARAVTDTFAGIRPADVVGFIAAQAVGGLAATALFRWLVPVHPRSQIQWSGRRRGRSPAGRNGDSWCGSRYSVTFMAICQPSRPCFRTFRNRSRMLATA